MWFAVPCRSPIEDTRNKGGTLENSLTWFRRLPGVFCTNHPLGGLGSWLGGLLVEWRFHFNFARGTAKFALKFVSGLLEFPETPAKTTGKLRKFFRTKEQHHDDKNKDHLRTARHTKRNWNIHSAKIRRKV
jgi:hypothetical protein